MSYPTKYVAIKNECNLRCNYCGNELEDEQTYIKLNFCPCCGRRVEEIVREVYRWDEIEGRMIKI